MTTSGLQLPLREGVLTTIDQSFGDEHYVVHRESPTFNFFWHMTLSISAMTLAIASINKMPIAKGDYIGLSGVGFDYVVRVPAQGAIDEVMHGYRTKGMVITLHWGRDANAQSIWPDDLRRWMDMILWPGFVHLYEEHEKAIMKSRDEAGRLARLLRDAYAHGGVINNSISRIEASWQGVTIKREDHGRPVSDFVGGSDLIVLALKLSSLVLAS
jgi:hypothetical protein